MKSISLVIPGRNAAKFLPKCIESVQSLISSGTLAEVIYVDDSSTDNSFDIAKSLNAICLRSEIRGPSAARNLGWRAAQSDLIWFLDVDCYVESQTLQKLLDKIDRADIVGGGYYNANAGNLLPDLLQAEFEFRYSKMEGEVSYATTCNLLCKKNLLLELNGFNQEVFCVEDGEFIFHALELKKIIIFEPDSRVYHHHVTSLSAYLKKQGQHGYWASKIYRNYPSRVTGHSYTSTLDHIQPLLMLLSLLSWVYSFKLALIFLLIFYLANLPIFIYIKRNISLRNAVCFIILSFFRTIARLGGIILGVFL